MKKQSKQKTLGVIIVLLIGLFAINVFLSQQIYSINLKLTDLNQKNIEQNNQITHLKIKLSQSRSIDLVLKKAAKLGFIESEQILYLDQKDALAKNE